MINPSYIAGADYIARTIAEYATDNPDATAFQCAIVAGSLVAALRPLTEAQIARGQQIEAKLGATR